MSSQANRSFDDCLANVIKPVIQRYTNATPFMAQSDYDVTIRKLYNEFNSLCKTEYMVDGTLLIDRHKVAACYMLAIIKAKPLVQKDVSFSTDGLIVTANEHLAITVGLSILACFRAKDSNFSLNTQNIKLPTADHGDYRNNFAVELYYTAKDDNYNILSLSHTLFLLDRLQEYLP